MDSAVCTNGDIRGLEIDCKRCRAYNARGDRERSLTAINIVLAALLSGIILIASFLLVEVVVGPPKYRIPSPTTPEQVHLALGRTEETMTVAWVTAIDVPSEVQWGRKASSLTASAQGDSRKFIVDSGRTWYTHVATLTGLSPNTRYFYRVGGSKDYSQVFDFIHRRVGAPYRHVIMGDLGAESAFSICNACTAASAICDASTCKSNLTVGLVSEIGKADHFLHLGDFAYDLDTDNGQIGDQFMRNIEQIAAKAPYMVSQGNHEAKTSGSLAHFVERFRSQPSNAVPASFSTRNGETTNTMYFSWDYGLVHYVSISTELWFGTTDGNTTKQTCLDWLKKDLVAANKNRAVSPWIIVQGHRSIYCSCDGDCDGAARAIRNDMEEVLMEYGVDFFINGHEHNYERSYPIYKGKSDRSNVNPKAPIYIVSGAAGSREMQEPFMRPQPFWSVFRSNTFGYSVLTAYNATHVRWQQISTDPTSFPMSKYGDIIDDDWIVQHSHGPFDRDAAPKGEAHTVPALPNRQFDHWWPLLNRSSMLLVT